MQRTLMAAAILAGSVAVASLIPSNAEALPLAKSQAAPQGVVVLVGRRGPMGPGGPHMHGPHGPGMHFRPHGPRFYGPRFRGGFWPYYGYGFGALPYYDYGDNFDDSYAECAPLRRRALATGKRYWWNRYHACMED